jgi:hypothetical protein
VYAAEVRYTIFVIAFAPVMPLVELVRLADTVPLETLNPLPTITAPATLAVANGRRATGRVPELMLVATVVSVVALAANPDTAEEAMATAVDPAAVRRPAASTVNVATDVADP